MYASCIIWPNSVVLHNIMLMHTTDLYLPAHTDCIIVFTACVCAAVKLHACCRYRDFFCPLLAVEAWSSQSSVCSCPSFTPPTPSVFFSIYCLFVSSYRFVYIAFITMFITPCLIPSSHYAVSLYPYRKYNYNLKLLGVRFHSYMCTSGCETWRAYQSL